MDAVIMKLFKSELVYCEYIHPTERSGDAVATGVNNMMGINGEIIKHPNYFIKRN